jgi:hypothetical protein
VVRTATRVREETGFDLGYAEWQEIARTPRERLRDLFHGGEEDERPQTRLVRAREADPSYGKLFALLNGQDPPPFPDLKKVATPGQARTIEAVVKHVVQWIKPDGAATAPGEGGRLQTWEELIPAVRAEGAEDARARSIRLLAELARHTTEHLAETKRAPIKGQLKKLPEGEWDAYRERFKDPFWRELLPLVRRFADLTVAFGSTPPDLETRPTARSIGDEVYRSIQRHPSIQGTPLLCSTEAQEALRSTLERWATEQLGGAGSQRRVPETVAQLVGGTGSQRRVPRTAAQLGETAGDDCSPPSPTVATARRGNPATPPTTSRGSKAAVRVPRTPARQGDAPSQPRVAKDGVPTRAGTNYSKGLPQGSQGSQSSSSSRARPTKTGEATESVSTRRSDRPQGDPMKRMQQKRKKARVALQGSSIAGEREER